jgi:ATP-dependent DNA helicase RecG
LKPNEFFYCTGKLSEWNGRLQLNDITWIPSKKIGGIYPVYPSVPKTITSEKVSEKINIAIENYINVATQRVIKASACTSEQEVIDGSGIPFNSLRDFFYALHKPNTVDEFNLAMSSIKKIACFEIVSYAEQKDEIEVEESYIDIDEEYINKLIKRTPFPLTSDQRFVIKDIINDLKSSKPMNRLLSGDVGTGKTIAYMIPAIAAVKAGKRVAIMVQSFLVANQVSKEIKEYFPEIKVVFKAGTMKKKEMEAVEKQIDEGEAIIVGTSAITSSITKKDFDLDLLIVDEQHRMGKEQREELRKNHTNILEATATAIPRTMAIISHGGMDISYLKEKPVYKNIKTVIWDESHQKDLMNEIKKIVAEGYQCAIVYPVVDEKDKILDENGEEQEEQEKNTEERRKVKHAVEAYEKMCKLFPDNVALLHGKMKDADKDEVLQGLKANKKQILIASSVIEIGVTLPSMMMLAVIDPDLHGVTSLHQLRGRVDRNGKITASGLLPKFIMMVRRNMTEKIRDRLNILVSFEDGFEVAEQDMLQRGFGELSGTKQSGSTSSIFIGVKLTPQCVTDFIASRGTNE